MPIVDAIGGGTVTNPAGNNKEIQYNNSNVFGSSPNLEWENTTSKLSINGETRIIGAGTSGYSSDRNFQSERILKISSNAASWIDFFTIEQFEEGTTTPTTTNWGHCAFDIFIIGNQSGRGTTLRHVVGAVEWQNGAMAAYEFSNSTTGSGAGNQMDYQVIVDHGTRKATFQINPTTLTSTAFGGTISVKIVASSGDYNQTQDYVWSLATPFD